MNKVIIRFALFLICTIFTFGANFASANNSNLQGYVVYVPSGITLNAVLSTEINSQSAVVGQVINCVLVDDFYYNSNLIASSGSVIQGSVISNKKAGYGNKNAQMQIKFTTIRTPYNNIIPISASIYTQDESDTLKGATTLDSAKEYAKDTAIGAATGAIGGTIMGALSSGSVGKGAIYGSAIGAGMGIIKNVAQKGDSIIIPSNSQITLYFDQPITLGAQ